MSISTAIVSNTMPDQFTILLHEGHDQESYIHSMHSRYTYLIQEFKALKKFEKSTREEGQRSLHKFLSQRQLVLSSQKLLHFSKVSGKCPSTTSVYGKQVLLQNLLGSLHDMSGLFMHLAATACAGEKVASSAPSPISLTSASLWQTLS